METPKKRKREPDPLRVTYDAETRTFDRLFKEHSLEEMRAVIRKKMSLPDTVKLRLYQMRDGKSIDLEDDDDFEAFAASSRISSTATVRVVFGDKTVPPGISTDNDAQATPKVKKNKKHADRTHTDPAASSTTSEDGQTSVDALRPAKKRRVSFAEALSSPPLSSTQEISKKRRLSMSDLGESPSSSTVTNPAPALPSGASQEETDVTDDRKRKRKKKKKQPSPDAENTQKISNEARSASQPELSSQTTASTVDRQPNDQPSKKSKKRLRAVEDDSERGESTTTPAPAHLVSAPTSDQEPEQPPPKKKSKQKNSIENGLHYAIESSNIEVAGATPSPATDGTVLVDTSEHPKKKEKKKKQKTQSESLQEPSGKSDDMSKSIASNEQADTTPIPENPPAPQNSDIHDSSKQNNKRSKKKEKTNDSQESSQVTQPDSVAIPPVLAASEGAPTAEKGLSVFELYVVVLNSLLFLLVKKRKSKQSPDKTADQASQGFSTPNDDPLPAQHRSDASVDKPTKKKSDKKDVDGAVESGSAHQPQTIDAKEATIAAVQAIMARYTGKKSSTNPRPIEPEPTANESQVDTVQALLTDSTPPQNASKPTLKVTPPGEVEQPSKGLPAKITAGSKDTAPESKTEPTTSVSRKVKPTSCPYCDTTPYHYRSKCKLFRSAGVKSLEARIQQLEAIPGSSIEDVQKQNVLEELKREVENKSGRPYIAPSLIPTTPAPASSKPTTSTETLSFPPSHSNTLAVRSPAQLNGATVPPLTPPSTDQQSASESSQSEDEARLPVAPGSTNKTPSKISTIKSPQETSKGPPKPKPLQVINPLNTLVTAFSPFLDVRDISSYTEKDLEALIRGPPVSSKDVPSTETSEDEDEQGGEDLVVDEDEDGRESTNERSRPNYASEEEEEEEEEEDLSEGVDKVSAPLEPPRLVSEALGKDTSESSGSGGSSPENFHEGNISFQQMEALGSFLQIDRTGDVAFETAYANDVASVSGNPTLTYDKPVGSDKAPSVPPTQLRQESEESEDAIVEEPTPAQPSEPAVADDEDDPIEEEDPGNSQEKVTPSAATPKNAPTLQTRAQKASKGGDEASSHPAVVAEDTPLGRSTRKKGALTPISELPIPPHPGVRVIKPPLVGSQASSKTSAKTPARGRQRVIVVAEEIRVDETVSTDPPARVTRRSLRSAVTGTSVVSTPVQRGTNTNAQLALEHEEEDGAEVPRTRPRTRLQRPTSTQPEATPTNPGSKTSKPTSKANGNKIPAKPSSKAPAASNKKQQGFEQSLDQELDTALGTQVADDTVVGSWMTLPESQGRDSQTMTDTNEMTDELLPSSNPFTGSSQNPLFLHSETQQSLPYSQHPDVTTKEAGSPNESDEENEVEAVIQSAPISAPRYRGLTELRGVKNFSKPTLRPARFEQKPVHDLYGRSGKDSDSSDGSDSSDSEAEGNGIESHIPESRRAGGQTTRRK
ncbi:hypothetical protein BJ165DRAFT_957972 [Panaeolus papilionaceus]|nr:hypothetical protein BJ165DRAFT_957972 [Panaeolus papilionaceus]